MLYRLCVPTLKSFAGCRIAMYPRDHNPPHFHLIGSDFRVLVEIGTWQVVGSYGRSRDIAEAMAWAKANEPLLRAKWKELNP